MMAILVFIMYQIFRKRLHIDILHLNVSCYIVLPYVYQKIVKIKIVKIRWSVHCEFLLVQKGNTIYLV